MATNKKEQQPEDLVQIRNLLFGEQADQYDERFQAVENSINSLRRENRNLRNALEVEATARTANDNEHNQRLVNERDAALTALTDVLATYLQEERANRATQSAALLATLDAYRQQMDSQTDAAIAQLQAEKKERAAQFSALQKTLQNDQKSQDDVTSNLLSTLDGFRQGHITELDIVSENGAS
jgi:valyl-tRNA synthetase